MSQETEPTSAVPDLATVRQEVVDVVTELLEDENRAAVVTESTPIADLGLDSIALMFVYTHFERRYDVTFENDALRPDLYPTVGDVATVIAKHLSERG